MFASNFMRDGYRFSYIRGHLVQYDGLVTVFGDFVLSGHTGGKRRVISLETHFNEHRVVH